MGNSTKNILAEVNGPMGFSIGSHLKTDELNVVKTLIERQWLDRITEFYPDKKSAFAQRGIERYHELSHLVDHTLLWPKPARCLPKESADYLRKTSLLKQLDDLLAGIVVYDNLDIGCDVFTWRLVRPEEPLDVGPIHSDRWFRTVAPEGYPAIAGSLIKVWIAILCEPGLNGLQVLPGSHMKSWRYHGVFRHGTMKPQIDEDINTLDMHLINTKPGEAVIFHDDLLHGGVLNKGNNARISLEFTMMVNG